MKVEALTENVEVAGRRNRRRHIADDGRRRRQSQTDQRAAAERAQLSRARAAAARRRDSGRPRVRSHQEPLHRRLDRQPQRPRSAHHDRRRRRGGRARRHDHAEHLAGWNPGVPGLDVVFGSVSRPQRDRRDQRHHQARQQRPPRRRVPLRPRAPTSRRGPASPRRSRTSTASSSAAASAARRSKNQLFWFANVEKTNEDSAIGISTPYFPDADLVRGAVRCTVHDAPGRLAGVADSNDLFVRWSRDDNDSLGNFGGNRLPSSGNVNSNTTNQVVVGLDTVLTPKLTNSFRTAFTDFKNRVLRPDAAAQAIARPGIGRHPRAHR